MAKVLEGLNIAGQGLARLAPGRYGIKGRAGVKITELSGANITQLAFFPEQESAVKTLLKRQFKLPQLPDFSASCQNGDSLCLRAEMGKLWLVTAQPVIAGLPASTAKYYPLDISASKVCLQLSGAEAASLINRQAAVDLSCPDGQFMATGMHHIGVHILKISSQNYLLFLPSSFAESLAHSLFEIACQFGVRVSKPVRWPENGPENDLENSPQNQAGKR